MVGLGIFALDYPFHSMFTVRWIPIVMIVLGGLLFFSAVVGWISVSMDLSRILIMVKKDHFHELAISDCVFNHCGTIGLVHFSHV
jgi:protein-S-isoprenylcysteine O-methyltransferase Ste14